MLQILSSIYFFFMLHVAKRYIQLSFIHSIILSFTADTFTCDFEPDGKVMIKGITSTGEQTVKKNNMEFVMLSQNLCPPGEFSISFQLPGAIDHQQVKAVFGIDGVFEGVVKKRQPSSF